MGWEDGRNTESGPSRRRLLRSIAAGSVVGTGMVAGCTESSGESTESADDRVTLVLSTAQSGQYELLGEQERRGFELAVEHLNGGGGLVEAGAFPELDGGEGINDHVVDTAVVDTESDAETARSNLRPYVEGDDPVAICGGVGGSVVRAHRDLAAEHDVTYMVGASLRSDLAGERCSPTVYRESYTSEALMRGLGPVLADRVGERESYYQLYTDAPEGEDLRSAVNGYFNRSSTPDWRPQGGSAIQRGSTTFESQLESASAERPDVLFVCLFGLDAVNALAAADEVLSDDVDVVVPYLDDSYAHVLESDLRGVVGTVPWHPDLDSEHADAFWDAYQDADGDGDSSSVPGSGTAHVTYTQTLRYAAAATRAGSFDPEDVRAELTDGEYDVGLGAQRLQSCNHQSTRPVPVATGRSVASGRNGYVDLLEVREDVTADCDSAPASSCSF